MNPDIRIMMIHFIQSISLVLYTSIETNDLSQPRKRYKTTTNWIYRYARFSKQINQIRLIELEYLLTVQKLLETNLLLIGLCQHSSRKKFCFPNQITTQTIQFSSFFKSSI